MLSNLLIRFTQSKTATSTLWVTAEAVFSQLIRLGGNLVLTRLLAPEFFGVMAVLYSISGFFYMISDIGLVPSIVNTKREKDSLFMETAWTIQFLRSSILSIVTIMAAYPISLAFNEPMLLPLLLIVALTNLIAGFNSTALILEQKYLRQKKLAITNLSIRFVAMISMIVVAYFLRNIWALVAGNVVTCLCTLYCSYRFFSPHHSRFRFEKEAAQEIIHFGKWILIASLFGYFASQSGPLIMGAMLNMNQLGLFVVASTLAAAVEALLNQLSAKVLQPRYRELLNGSDSFRGIYRLRNNMNLIFLPSCIVLAIFGDFVIEFMYDDRYANSGWVLQILAIGRIATLLTNSARPMLISIGDSKGLMINQGIAAFITIASLLIGGKIGGFEGIVLASATSPFLQYVVLSSLLLKHKIRILPIDVVLSCVTLSIIIFGWYLTGDEPLRIIAKVLNL